MPRLALNGRKVRFTHSLSVRGVKPPTTLILRRSVVTELKPLKPNVSPLETPLGNRIVVTRLRPMYAGANPHLEITVMAVSSCKVQYERSPVTSCESIQNIVSKVG